MRTYAIDTETYYDGSCSVTKLGTWGYIHHPDFECYMVSVVGDDGYKFVGKPTDVPWHLIGGEGVTWVSHNMSFDRNVLEHLASTGIIPLLLPEKWRCTADLCAWAGLPRSLDAVCKVLYGYAPDKNIRANMQGVKAPWDMEKSRLDALLQYALDDCVWCLRLWHDLSRGSHPLISTVFSDVEQLVSEHTALLGYRGVPVNVERIDEAIRHLSDMRWAAHESLPWVPDSPPLSPKALALECRKNGIDPPRSLAKDSEECAAWEDKYGEQFPWVDQMRLYRRTNILLEKLKTMRSRVNTEGRMTYALKYCGAHTRRWSGDSGVNMQNLPRTEMFGVDVRGLIECAPGRTFVIVDLSQIEPRCLHLLAGDDAMLENIRRGYGVYEAFALKNNMAEFEPGKLSEKYPDIYLAAKAAVLACGYGVSGTKFMSMAPTLTGGKFAPTAHESDQTVAAYRRQNPLIVGLWARLDAACRALAGRGDFTVELPSGNMLRYHKIANLGGNVSGEIMRQGRYVRSKLYGGLLTENLVQAVARDVFVDRMAALIKALPNMLGADAELVLHVHDEYVVECNESQGESVLAHMLHIIKTPPTWLAHLPLDAKGHLSKTYIK